MRTALLTFVAFAWLGTGEADAQAPAGAIAGVVRDSSGAAIEAASVVITNKHTAQSRIETTAASGDYRAAALPAGEYEVAAEAIGFTRILKEQVIVETGITTTVNVTMPIGEINQTVTVNGAETPQIRYDTHAISGVITRLQIEALPLNGRGSLDLSKLEPGAQQPVRTSNNRTLVPLLGAPAGQNGRATRVTVDGGSIMQIGNGGSAMGLSEEVVQEFQVSTVNFDPSAGLTASGTVNIVTRSGTNDLRGSSFLFFRDHRLSAYPGLERDALNPDPFFQRRQFGVETGGPIRKKKVFFFGTWERNEQRGVVSTTLLTPEFAPLSGVFPSPTYTNQFSGRVDVRLTDKHFAFFRQSDEAVSFFGTTGLTMGGSRALPSAWRRQPGRADQSLLGLTSLLGANLVNDLRVSVFLVNSSEQSPIESDCPGCLGIGAPSITVVPDLFIGSSLTTSVIGRRYHVNDVGARQKGAHVIRFGGDLELATGGRTDVGNEPVTMTLFSPEQVRNFNGLPSTSPSRRIPLPVSFVTLEDILQLPVQSFAVAIGDAHVPQEGFGLKRVAPVVRLFCQDTWRLGPRVSINYGLGWTYDAPFNYDLAKPAFLAAVVGGNGLAATHRNWHNFSPAAGFAWSPRADGKTVVRGGAGIYYDFGVPFGTADSERVSLGPRGVGRGTYPNTVIANPLSGIPGVAPGMLLNFRGNPTLFTGTALMQALPAIRADLTQLRGDPDNRDFSVTNIEVDKTGLIVAADLPSISATHASLGVQREVATGLVVSADFVVRQFSHLGMQPDLNHFSKVGGPVLPVCTSAQRGDSAALCSLGPIRVFSAIGHATYQGLLVRVDKRFSQRWQFLGSYAYSSNVGTNAGSGFNNDDPLANYGPLDRDIRHILNLSGFVQLPLRLRLGVFATYNSKPPFSAFFSSLDLNGDGTTGDLLPGSRVNQFNRGLGKEDLRRLVEAFNIEHGGGTDAQGRNIPFVTLPADFELGDRFLTADLRLSWELPFRHGRRLMLIGEVFNLFNTQNLSGRSGDLSNPESFGQPSGLVTQVFGSGGPRSFQLAARMSF